MSVPYTILVQIAFEDLPLVEADAGPPEVPAWFDVAEFVRDEITTGRGRASEFDEINAGTASFVLTNSNRRFDPDNAAGIYYPNIVPGRKVRIGASVDAVIYWRFTGFIQSWNVEYEGGTESYATVRCVDAFKYFNLMRINGTPAAQLTSDRINAILDGITLTTLGQIWPTSDRDIATGAVTVQEAVLENENVLAHIQKVTRAENGLFFIAGDGDATFQNQSHRDSPSSEAIFNNKEPPVADDLPFARLITSFDDSMIWNQVQITRQDGIRQTAQDLTSQDNYFTRTLERTGDLYEDDTDALAAAELLLARYKEPWPRPKTLVVNPAAIGGAASVEDAYAEVLEREISDAITVKRTTLIDGNETVYEAFIEGIEDRITLQQWVVTFTLSPVITLSPGAGTLNTDDDWLIPTLQNSWVDYGLGRPVASYRKEGNWIYLRGAVKDGSSAAIRIMTLPVGYRPPFDHVSTVDSDGAYARLLIQADGDVFCVGGSTNSVDFSGVHFRVI